MDERALIFANLLNGVSVAQVARDFRVSEPEVMNTFSNVLRKVKSYCFLRARQKNAVPLVIASTIEEAKKYRLTCLHVLPKLNLDKAPHYKDIQGEIVTPDNIMAVARNMG